MSRNKRHTDSAEPTEPLDDIGMLLTSSELAIACLVITFITALWIVLLAFVGGYAWERWLAEFVLRATGWLLLP